MLSFCFEIIQLLVKATDIALLDAVDEGHYTLPEVTVQEMYVFLAVIVQMGYDLRDTLKDYWSALEQYFMVFYRNTMKCVRFYHIHRFLHFSDHKNDPDKTDENYDQMWKMRAIFDKLC